MSSSNSEAVKKIFDERKDFTIIGLTGRTGSGCTTTAKFLMQSFNDLNIPAPFDCPNASLEDRKYSIIHKYIESNWEPFKVIEIRNIITSFILEYPYYDFVNHLKEIYPHNISELVTALDDDIKATFDDLHNIRCEIMKKTIADENYLKEDQAFKFYFKTLPAFSSLLKKQLNTFHRETYTKIYQNIGNNIRKSGSPYSHEFLSTNMFKLVQRTNTLIKSSP